MTRYEHPENREERLEIEMDLVLFRYAKALEAAGFDRNLIVSIIKGSRNSNAPIEEIRRQVEEEVQLIGETIHLARQNTFEMGLREGEKSGLNEGFKHGKIAGRVEGHGKGFVAGMEEGYTTGFEEGRRKARRGGLAKLFSGTLLGAALYGGYTTYAAQGNRQEAISESENNMSIEKSPPKQEISPKKASSSKEKKRGKSRS